MNWWRYALELCELYAFPKFLQGYLCLGLQHVIRKAQKEQYWKLLKLRVLSFLLGEKVFYVIDIVIRINLFQLWKIIAVFFPEAKATPHHHFVDWIVALHVFSPLFFLLPFIFSNRTHCNYIFCLTHFLVSLFGIGNCSRQRSKYTVFRKEFWPSHFVIYLVNWALH